MGGTVSFAIGRGDGLGIWAGHCPGTGLACGIMTFGAMTFGAIAAGAGTATVWARGGAGGVLLGSAEGCTIVVGNGGTETVGAMGVLWIASAGGKVSGIFDARVVGEKAVGEAVGGAGGVLTATGSKLGGGGVVVVGASGKGAGAGTTAIVPGFWAGGTGMGMDWEMDEGLSRGSVG